MCDCQPAGQRTVLSEATLAIIIKAVSLKVFSHAWHRVGVCLDISMHVLV